MLNYGLDRFRNLICLLVLFSACGALAYGASQEQIPDFVARSQTMESRSEQTAVLAGGCFWGVDAVFKHVKGVSNVVSGSSGGRAAAAKYESVGPGPARNHE